jgi:hypothetical protein
MLLLVLLLTWAGRLRANELLQPCEFASAAARARWRGVGVARATTVLASSRQGSTTAAASKGACDISRLPKVNGIKKL